MPANPSRRLPRALAVGLAVAAVAAPTASAAPGPEPGGNRGALPADITAHDSEGAPGARRANAPHALAERPRMPAHCTAVGKALLAFSDDVGEAFLAANAPLARHTARTITDPDQLRRELHDVRRGGLAYDREEAMPGLACVAAPLMSAKGTARAALSVSMPANGPLTFGETAPVVRAAARALTRELLRSHVTV